MLKNRLIKDTTKLGFSTIISKFIVLIRGFIIPRLVSPEAYGLFRILLLVHEYSGLSHLGLTHALDKQLPFYRGSNDEKSLKKSKNSVYTILILFGIIVGMGIGFSSYIYIPAFNSDFYKKGLWIVGFTVPLMLYYQNSLVLLRTNNNFTIISVVTVLFAFISLIMAILLGMHFGALGLILSVFSSYVITNLFLIFKGKFQLKFGINKDQIFNLFKIGLPLLGIQFLYQLLLTTDSLLVVKFLPTLLFGYYGIAVTISRSIFDIPMVIIGILFPRSSEKFGRTGEPRELEKYVVIPLILTGLLLPFIIGVLMFLSEIFIIHILPMYWPAYKPTEYLLLGAFFLSVSLVCYQMFIAIGKISYIVWIYILTIVLEYFFCLTALKFSLGLEGVAIGRMMAYMILAILIIWNSCSYFQYSVKRKILFLLKLIVPLIYTIIFILFIQFILHLNQFIIHDIMITVVRILLLIIFSMPLFIIANKRTDLFSILLNEFRSRINHR